jgi:DNA-binding MarR family transcriptional regulator
VKKLPSNKRIKSIKDDTNRTRRKAGFADTDLKSTVLSLAKGFRVLELFTAKEPELNLSEIAHRAELDTGTAFRIIRTLVLLGYLEQSEGAKRYRLALRVIDLGLAQLPEWISSSSTCSALLSSGPLAKLQVSVFWTAPMLFISIAFRPGSLH